MLNNPFFMSLNQQQTREALLRDDEYYDFSRNRNTITEQERYNIKQFRRKAGLLKKQLELLHTYDLRAINDSLSFKL